ncbi:MAG: MOP family protein [Candidatus Lumbricidophila eiseniae]|uniref:MOP family protein n=1 Tax=Candidatus Lumbricidiphila eiseniae TaxID=1969409 RepID=A0A2A6FRB3_9MICO|nr:MAG: MOP family protein [Candidatus Lumbricidophila eiseniae]
MSTDHIGRASVYLATGTVVSRVLGFLKAVVLASTIGVIGSPGADAFAVANGLPNTVYVIVAGGVLSAVLVPQIVQASRSTDDGSAYINRLLTLALVVIGAATVIATALAPVLTWFYAGSQPSILPLAIAFAWWCLPQIFFYGLYTVLSEVLNARRSFGPSTWVPVLNNVVALAGLVLFGWAFGFDHDGNRMLDGWSPSMIALLGGSATLGIVAQAVILFWFWRRVGLRYRPDFRWRGVGLGAAGRLAGWTFGMLLLTTFAGVIQTQVTLFASGHGASLAAVESAWLIFMLPHSVITVSIATAYFTRMSEHVLQDSLDKVRQDFSSAVRTISVILTLATAVLVVLAYPIATVFQPNNYSAASALGNVIIAFAVGLLGFSVLFVAQRTFFALGDTRTPFFFTLCQVVIFTAAALLCLLLPLQWVAVGVAGATTLAGTTQLILALVALRRRLGGLDGGRIVTSMLRSLAAVILPLVGGFALLNTLGGFAVSSRGGAMIAMVLVGALMLVLYAGCLALVRSLELQTLLRRRRARE